jgi:lipoate-protein ligase A
VHIGLSCPEEFAADERLLRRGEPAVRVSVLDGPAVSYGVGVREDADYLARARGDGVPVARRTSGGTGVLHAPGDLAWSLVIPRADPLVGRDFVRGYSRLGAGVVRFLARVGISATWEPAPGLTPDYCVLGPRGQVLSVGPHVLGGAAQHLSRTALLHQGMIPLTVDRERIARLFAIPDLGWTARLTGLRELGVTAPPRELADQLAAALVRDLAQGAR